MNEFLLDLIGIWYMVVNGYIWVGDKILLGMNYYYIYFLIRG